MIHILNERKELIIDVIELKIKQIKLLYNDISSIQDNVNLI